MDYKERFLILKELLNDTNGLTKNDIAEVANAMAKVSEEEKKENKGE